MTTITQQQALLILARVAAQSPEDAYYKCSQFDEDMASLLTFVRAVREIGESHAH